MTRLRELRQQRNLSVIGLSYETRIHPTEISGIEHRKRAASANARAKLCAFFGVAESETFEEGGLAV